MTITVTDIDEPPARPAQPTVTVPAAPRTLTITWSPPTNTGPPITSYTLQYRKGASGHFADVHTGPALSHTHSGLTANSRYDYQVLATNDEGSSPYSPVGQGSTPPNVSPTFGAVRSYENDLQEDIGNTPGSIQTLKPVNATDPDNGTITYTLEGPDRNSFTIDETTGAIQTKARIFDHESKATYSFQARASDNHRGETPFHDQVDITVNILDLNELPLTPTDVVAEHPTRFQYQIRWSPPENTGRPPIDHYTTEWTTDRNSPPTSKETATTSSTVTALLPNTVYSTRVTAHNADGDGQPSQWQDIRTLPNNPPVFAATSRTRILDENNAPQANVGSPIQVTDPDSDTIAYSIDGANPGGFTIEPTTGQIKAGNRIYNHEQTPSYTITVTANDQHGGSTSQNIDITIRDLGEPPHKVQLPTASNQSLTSITFTWNEPTNTGPPVTGYAYQYRKGSAGWRPDPADGRNNHHPARPGPGQPLLVPREGRQRRRRRPLFRPRRQPHKPEQPTGVPQRHNHADGQGELNFRNGRRHRGHRPGRRDPDLLGRWRGRDRLQPRLQSEHSHRDHYNQAHCHHRLRNQAILLGEHHRPRSLRRRR